MSLPPPPTPIVSMVAALAGGCLTSCSLLKRPPADGNAKPLAPLFGAREEGSTSTERLQAIADSPNAQLPSNASVPDSADSPSVPNRETSEAAEPATPTPTNDPSEIWAREALDPRAIAPGDVFSEQAGPVLNKGFSVADALPADERTRWLETTAETSRRRAPITLSQRELAVLRARVGSEGPPLPSRSVALDYEAVTHRASAAELEDLFATLTAGDETPPGLPRDAPEELAERLETVRGRLRRGEELSVVVGVTASEQVRATYPGAPVGERDAEPIRNAFQLLYPRLDDLRARKVDGAIVIERDPALYWEFDVRSLALDGDRIVVEPTSAAR